MTTESLGHDHLIGQYRTNEKRLKKANVYAGNKWNWQQLALQLPSLRRAGEAAGSQRQIWYLISQLILSSRPLSSFHSSVRAGWRSAEAAPQTPFVCQWLWGIRMKRQSFFPPPAVTHIFGVSYTLGTWKGITQLQRYSNLKKKKGDLTFVSKLINPQNNIFYPHQFVIPTF